jgi:hypothetical protein
MIPEYSQLTRDELLRIALQREALTEDARLALDAEFSRRKIASHEIAVFSSEEAAAVLAGKKVIREVLLWGIGKRLSGRRNYTHDPQFRIEEFDRTLWFVFFLCRSSRWELIESGGVSGNGGRCALPTATE